MEKSAGEIQHFFYTLKKARANKFSLGTRSMKHVQQLTLGLFVSTLLMPLAEAQDGGPEMVVTAARVEREVFQTPLAISVIDDKTLEESNVTATPDAFKYTEGVYIQKTNLGGGSPFIRGLTGKQVLIMVDGIRLNNSFYRFGPHQYLNTIDPRSIERIEVVRGPSSVLYGSDALGGVINIITKKRTDLAQASDNDFFLAATYDSATAGTSYADKTGGYALRAQLEGNRESFGWFIGASTKSYSDLEGGGDIGTQIPSGYTESAFDLKLNNELMPGRELLLGVQYLQQNDVPKTSEVTLDGKVQFNYEPQERTLVYLNYADKNTGLFDDMQLNISFNRQLEGEDIIVELPIQTTEETEVQTLGASAQFSNSLGDSQRITYGIEYYGDDYSTEKQRFNLDTGDVESIKPGVPDGATYESLGAFLQDEIRAGKYLEFIAGLRFSQFEAEGELEHPTEGTTTLQLDTDKTTGSLQALIKLSPQVNLVAGAAQGFRAPNMEDFFGRVDFSSEIPNTNLEPEESTNMELGIKYFTESTFAELFVYNTDYENLINRVDTQDALGNPVKQRQNIDEATIKGVEANLQHEFNRHWRFRLNAAWTEGRDADDKPLRRIPPLNANLQVRYTHTPNWWVQLESQWAAKQDELSGGDISDARIPEGGTPGYTVFSLKTGWKRTDNELLLLTLENLSDKEYKTHGSGLYAPGQSVVLSYELKFGN